MPTKSKPEPMITLSKGGTAERAVKLETLEIPDVWNYAQSLKKTDPHMALMIDRLWHTAHDLKRHALEQAGL